MYEKFELVDYDQSGLFSGVFDVETGEQLTLGEVVGLLNWAGAIIRRE